MFGNDFYMHNTHTMTNINTMPTPHILWFSFVSTTMSVASEEQIESAARDVSCAMAKLIKLSWPLGDTAMRWDSSAYVLNYTNGDVIVNVKISNNHGLEVVKEWQRRFPDAVPESGEDSPPPTGITMGTV